MKPKPSIQHDDAQAIVRRLMLGRLREMAKALGESNERRQSAASLQVQIEKLGPPWKVDDREFLPYHPSASHISPDYRDGWNQCFLLALDMLELRRRQVEGVTLTDPAVSAEVKAEMASMTAEEAREWVAGIHKRIGWKP